MILRDRSVIVTGASHGLGFEIARTCAREGASLAVCARGEADLARAEAALSGELAPGARLIAMPVDVADPAQVDAFVVRALSAFGAVHGLVNNAGVYGPLGAIQDVDWRGWTDAVAINLFGTVYPCRAVIEHFKRNGGGKIVNLSGGGATNPLPRVSAYAASKAAVVRFTETLAEETRDARIDVNAIAPGMLGTRLTRQLLDAGAEVVGADLHARIGKAMADGGAPLTKGAELAAWLLSPLSNGITGKLIAALWDPWREFPDRRAELDGSDIYTLRRIVPADRGKDWGG